MFSSRGNERPQSMATPYQYRYGPVSSRRFSRSLGIDLIPCKACCLDCVFCQLGPTHRKTIRAQAYRE